MMHLKYFLKVFLLFSIYFITAKVGLSLDAAKQFAAIVWPPTGIGLAALLLFGRSLWPAIFLGTFMASWTQHSPPEVALTMAMGNTFEALLAVYLLKRVVKFRNSLSRLRDILGLYVVAGVFCPMISATVGVACFWFYSRFEVSSLPQTWLTWWMGNFLGVLIFTPLLLTWLNPIAKTEKKSNFVEYFIFSISLIVLAYLFKRQNQHELSSLINFIYLIFLLLTWSAIRLGLRVTSTSIFVLSATSIFFTVKKEGPFVSSTLREGLFYLQMFLSTQAITSMIIATGTSELRLAKKVLEKRRERIKKNMRLLFIAKNAANAANIAKTRFLATMSHELRTPLGAILGFTDLLNDSALSMSEQKSYISIINRNAKHLVSIVDDLIHLSKTDPEDSQVNNTIISLPDLLTRILATFQEDIKIKNLNVAIHFEKDVPKLIINDRDKIERILVNIIGNAIKFTEHGLISIDVNINRFPEDQFPKIIFMIKDNGPGIPIEMQTNLFQPFMQVDDSMTRKHGGAGLGLAISDQLAKTLGGSLVLKDSSKDTGSAFIFSIPTISFKEKIALREPADKFSSADEESFENEKLKNLNLLLVEDSLDNQILLNAFLKNAGANVTIANDGKEALMLTRDNAFDAILMDIHMPNMDGYEATIKLREAGFTKPIIALTALAKKEDRERCIQYGFDDFLSKPVDRNLLIHKITSHAKKYENLKLPSLY